MELKTLAVLLFNFCVVVNSAEERPSAPFKPSLRNAFYSKSIKWNNVCVPPGASKKYWCIPYQMESIFNHPYAKGNIDIALNWFQENTCIAFIPRTPQNDDYVDIKYDKSHVCSSEIHNRVGSSGSKRFSYLGGSGGAGTGHRLTLGDGCYNWPTIVFHEFMHAIGMMHEQQRPDRDQYLNINVDNVLPNWRSQITQKTPDYDVAQRYAFDYNSVMIYGSKDGVRPELKECNNPSCWALMTKDNKYIPYAWEKPRPSAGDYQAINSYYGCPS